MIASPLQSWRIRFVHCSGGVGLEGELLIAGPPDSSAPSGQDAAGKARRAVPAAAHIMDMA